MCFQPPLQSRTPVSQNGFAQQAIEEILGRLKAEGLCETGPGGRVHFRCCLGNSAKMAANQAFEQIRGRCI